MQTIQNELPRQADAFVDSIGINIHLGAYGTMYVNDFPAVQSLLSGLGVRHVRDGIALNQPTICSEDKTLASQGIHFDFVSAIGETAAVLDPWASCVGSAIEAMEGPNEYDLSHPSTDSNWTGSLDTFQQALYTGVKGTSSGMTVLAPALTTQTAYASVGNLSGDADDANMHNYFAGRNPGTPGWGGTDAFGTYGSLPWNMALARQDTGSKPIYATETGYADQAGLLDAVSPATKARYTIRTFLEDWNAGVVRTYTYELVDESDDSYVSYGITDQSGNPKPAYTAMKNLIAHLADPGASFSPTPLAYTLTVPSSVHHTLLERRNGSYALVIWVEEPDWDPDTDTALPVATATATLQFTNTPHSVTATTFNDTGNVSTAPLAVTANSATLTVSDNVTIVDITP
ncbi:MAG TPA: hypothetical protein VMA36_12775 [Candidatus Limnocylindria bacterium]|nr:hypothetical protein [Candidatus Limnocylindria bacterium]